MIIIKDLTLFLFKRPMKTIKAYFFCLYKRRRDIFYRGQKGQCTQLLRWTEKNEFIKTRPKENFSVLGTVEGEGGKKTTWSPRTSVCVERNLGKRSEFRVILSGGL